MAAKFAVAALLVLFRAALLQAAAIRGIVVDIESQQPIAGATIRLAAIERTAATDTAGAFVIDSLKSGSYTIHVSHVAYKDNTVAVSVSFGEKRSFAIYLVPRVLEAAGVVVMSEHEHSRIVELKEPAAVLHGRDLHRELGLTLAATLKNETGLAVRSLGPAPARPVIRGLGGDRVAISEDGIATVDLSATSPDHAVTIEPFAIERVEVVRGPRALLQAPSAFGGAVNVVRHEIPDVHHDEIYGVAGAYAETANSGGLGSLLLDLPLHPLALRGEFSRRSAGDLRTPVGRLVNSDSRTTDWSLGGSLIDRFGFVGVSFRQFDLDYGIPGGFIGAHPKGVEIEMLKRQYNARSQINVGDGGRERLRLQVSRAYYRHKELEATGLIGSEFRVVNVAVRAELEHGRLAPLSGGTIAVAYATRDFDIGGYVFTPRSRSQSLAAIGYEILEVQPLTVEFAVRTGYDRITPEDERYSGSTVRKRDYFTWSASGLLLYALSEYDFLGVNLSRAARVPTLEELYSQGPHLAAYSYEVGNTDLDAEHGYGAEILIYRKTPRLYLMFTGFVYDLDSFIIPRHSGEINYQTFLPIYRTTGVAARLKGVEGLVEVRLLRNLTGTVSAGYTQGNFQNGGPLPQIPPLKVLMELECSGSKFSGGGNVQLAARQDRLDDFEEATPGYAVFNVFTQLTLASGSQIHTIALNLDNVLNKEYRNHLSRVKSVLPEAGRNLRATYKLFFGL